MTSKATIHPDHHLISSRDVEGVSVFDAQGNKIGHVDHLMIDKPSGNVAYAVISFGGFLGLGVSHYPVPWSVLTFDPSLEGFRTNITQSQLRDAPELKENSLGDRNWEDQAHQHFFAPHYWGSPNF